MAADAGWEVQVVELVDDEQAGQRRFETDQVLPTLVKRQ